MDARLLRATVTDPMGHDVAVQIRYLPEENGVAILSVMKWDRNLDNGEGGYVDVTDSIRRDLDGNCGVPWLGQAVRLEAVLDYEASRKVREGKTEADRD